VIVIDTHANEQEMLGAGVNLHFVALFFGTGYTGVYKILGKRGQME
jgi:hypothetical protein